MKKSIYNFSNFPQQGGAAKNLQETAFKVPEQVMHSHAAQDSTSLTLPPLSVHGYQQELTASKANVSMSNSSPNNHSVHEHSFSQNFATQEENGLALKASYSSDKMEGLSSKLTHDGSQKGADEGTKVCCKCKKSRCLKLYCDCFARGQYCQGDCVCVQCLNTKENEKERQAAISAISDKNPNAFKPKVDLASAIDHVIKNVYQLLLIS